MRVKLSGNHSNVHAGCRAVWQVLRERVERAGAKIVELEFDLLIVNGEGSMHHGSTTCRRKMSELENALDANRRASLVNTVWQANPSAFDHVLVRLQEVTCREILSQKDLRINHNIGSSTALDLSYFCDVNLPELTPVDFAGASVITDFFSPEFNNFVSPTAGPLAMFSKCDLNYGNWATLVQSLRTAGVLITGRHHAVYAACRARTPFLALTGNTHKIEGLIRSADADIPVFSEPIDLVEAIPRVQTLVGEFERLFDWMERQPAWVPQLD